VETRTARRFVAEATVIVLSILAAFAIDAWWEGRQELEKFDAYYAALEDEAQTNLNEIADAIAFAENGVDASRELRNLLRNGIDAVPLDSIGRLFGNSGAIISLEVSNVNMNVFDQLVATGDLGRMPDDEVRAAVLELDRALDRSTNYFERNLLEHRWSVTFPYWTQSTALSEAFKAFQPRTGFGEHRFLTDWAALANDRVFDNLLVTRMALGQEQVGGYRRVEAALEQLQEALRR
jgi:hypothetical protein